MPRLDTRENKMVRNLQRIAIFGLALFIISCTTQPIMNVQQAPINASKPNPQLEEVGKAIIRAGTGLGWQMTQQKPGLIQGRLALRTHVAVVDIKYNNKSYSIDYKDSTNLNYDAASGQIHRNYNGWIQNLDKAIQNQLATL
jgi:hypothetical protein